jgi:hypothetical protein
MRSRLVLALTLLALPVVPLVSGCNTYANNLARSREAYEQNQHERALAILRALEPDENHLTDPELTEYAYLRGMTDYRIGYLQDARHWLLVAKELDKANPKALNEDWKGRMTSAVDELNAKVFNEGIDSLSATQPKTLGGDDDKPKAKGEKTDKQDKSDKQDKGDKSDDGSGGGKKKPAPSE